ncbi:winged helix-turn-helix transcriptional regulator [Mesorhizobium sp. M0814]|uniref:Lrp/AsnC family transcriptional regulator n=1 Tax=Mesorhizobium sp. M0814 TaxID=2957004 RepID=UPI003337B5D0
MSKSELAKRVHLSASACSERLRVLQAAGIMEGFYARLSPALQALVFTAIGVDSVNSSAEGVHSRETREVFPVC